MTNDERQKWYISQGYYTNEWKPNPIVKCPDGCYFQMLNKRNEWSEHFRADGGGD
jgi:hypothetical protein